jgi:parvulin-like peptidyl-prolyl isomerase
MAKKRQSTPLPKSPAARPKVVQHVEPSLIERLAGIDPNHPSTTRAEREVAVQRLIWRLIIGSLVVIGIAVAIAFFFDGVLRPQQAIATVNGENITVAQFQERVRLERALQIELINDALNDIVETSGASVDEAGQFILQREPYATWWQELNTPDIMGLRVSEDLVSQKLLEAEAEKLGITVTDEDVQAAINQTIGYDPEEVSLIGADATETPVPTETPTPFVSPTPSLEPTATIEPTAIPTIEGIATVEGGSTQSPTITPAPTESVATLSATEVEGRFLSQKESLVRDIASRGGVSQDAVLSYFRFIALRDKVVDSVSEGASTQAVWADARHILVETEQEALDVIAALDAGESFAELARAVSTDTGSGAEGGELGLNDIAGYIEPFANAIRDGEVGEVIGPVETEFGFHIIQIRSKEFRESTTTAINLARQQVFTSWIADLRAANEGNFETFASVWADNIPSTPTFIYRER